MRRHKSDRWIGFIAAVLLLIGLIVIYAIGPMRANFSNASYGTTFSENYFFVHQLISVAISIAAFLVAFIFPYEKLKKISWAVLVLGLIACLVLVVAEKTGSSIASCQLGACRWINVGSVATIQPAEILKLGLILYLAHLVKRRREEGLLEKNDFWIPFSIVSLLSIIFVVFFQADLGSTVVIVAIILIHKFYKPKHNAEVERVEEQIPPYELAIQELQELRDSKLWQQGQEKQYYTRLVDILREYIDSRFGINAMEMTSAEIIRALKSNQDMREVNNYLNDILSMADFVKFAKMRPMPDDNERVMRRAFDFVELTRPQPTAESDTDTVEEKNENNNK